MPAVDYNTPMPDTHNNIVHALAECFPTPERATALLEDAGIPTTSLPLFGGSATPSPELYWREVLRRLDLGSTPDGRARLLGAARAALPDNAAFRADGDARGPSEPATAVAASAVSTARLPTTDLSHFVSRTAELDLLDAAWTDPATGIVAIVAPGGVGKTALTQRWMDGLRGDAWRGAEKVFGWSFYSQGMDGNASADGFFAEALEFFGWRGEPIASPWKRGETVARLARQAKTLLVLDGLEPLQFAPAPGATTGKLKDSGLQALVRELMASGDGLCVLSTRVPVHELAGRAGVRAIDLRTLDPEAGAALLGHIGVDGTEKELREASKEMGGHSLALTLLGTYVRDAFGGDIRRRREVKLLSPEAEGTEHARKVMASYEAWFLAEAKSSDLAELRILRLLGLFDRPADPATLKALRAEPPIPGLTDGLTMRDASAWNFALARLRKARLLLDDAPGPGGGLDAHPLVRAYFGERLAEENREAWQEGHLRIYRHLCATADDQPNDAEGMQPLYQAVVHGCRAGRVREARDEVYRRRIQRGDEFYSSRKLGAFGSELTALSAFFAEGWEEPSAELPEATRAWLLNEAAFDLRALGRLAEAVEPMRAGLDMGIAAKDWKEAAIRAGNLSELHLTLGNVEEAVRVGRESVELAERSGDAFWRMGKRTTHADALHQAGRLEESAALFREAEGLQVEWQPQYPLLYSLWGYRYCDLLLSEAKLPGLQKERVAAVIERGEKMFEWRVPGDSILDIALDHLTLGRAHHLLNNPKAATHHLDHAVDGLRQAGQDHEIPRGLLARAAHLRDLSANPLPDLHEALDLAERGGMRLYAADAHLEWTRHALATGDLATAHEHLDAARTLIDATGYARRRAEFDALAERAKVRAP